MRGASWAEVGRKYFLGRKGIHGFFKLRWHPKRLRRGRSHWKLGFRRVCGSHHLHSPLCLEHVTIWWTAHPPCPRGLTPGRDTPAMRKARKTFPSIPQLPPSVIFLVPFLNLIQKTFRIAKCLLSKISPCLWDQAAEVWSCGGRWLGCLSVSPKHLHTVTSSAKCPKSPPT